MATKPWPIAKTLAVPLKAEGAGEAAVIGLVAAGVLAPVPVAATVAFPPTGNGVAAGETAAGVVEAALVTAALLAAAEVAT